MKREYILSAFVAERLCHRKARESDARASAGNFIHLTEHERGFFEDARFLHFVIEVVAFTYTFTDSGEYGIAAVFGCDVVDEFLNENGLADACTTEETDLATLDERCE